MSLSYRACRVRITVPDQPVDPVVFEGLRPARVNGRETTLTVEPHGITRGIPVREAVAYIGLDHAPPKLIAWLGGAETVTLEVWSHLPQPDPDLYLHVTVDRVTVEDWVPGWSCWFGGQVAYAAGEEFMWQEVCDGPLPELTHR